MVDWLLVSNWPGVMLPMLIIINLPLSGLRLGIGISVERFSDSILILIFEFSDMYHFTMSVPLKICVKKTLHWAKYTYQQKNGHEIMWIYEQRRVGKEK